MHIAPLFFPLSINPLQSERPPERSFRPNGDAAVKQGSFSRRRAEANDVTWGHDNFQGRSMTTPRYRCTKGREQILSFVSVKRGSWSSWWLWNRGTTQGECVTHGHRMTPTTKRWLRTSNLRMHLHGLSFVKPSAKQWSQTTVRETHENKMTGGYKLDHFGY